MISESRIPVARPAKPAAPALRLVARTVPLLKAEVLVVEQDRELAAQVRRSLSKIADTTVVTSALVGLANILETGRFDLVVCDLAALEVPGNNLFGRLLDLPPECLERLALTMGSGPWSPNALSFLERMLSPVLPRPYTAEALQELVVERLAAHSF